jgi:hypothetical protein
MLIEKISNRLLFLNEKISQAAQPAATTDGAKGEAEAKAATEMSSLLDSLLSKISRVATADLQDLYSAITERSTAMSDNSADSSLFISKLEVAYFHQLGLLFPQVLVSTGVGEKFKFLLEFGKSAAKRHS